ncbi:uncharacterized protein LACBIDRAFT_294706, partial [Laccaria bicolor S238N-H82]
MYIHHLEKPDAPMSFSDASSNESPVKGDSESLPNNLDGGGDVKVADQDDFGVNFENSAQAFDSDSPTNSHPENASTKNQDTSSPPPEQDGRGPRVKACIIYDLPTAVHRRLSQRVVQLFKPRPKQGGGFVALETRTEDVCPPEVVQGTLRGVDERSSIAVGKKNGAELPSQCATAARPHARVVLSPEVLGLNYGQWLRERWSTIRRPPPLLSTLMALRRLNTIFSRSNRKSPDEESPLGRSPTYRTSLTRAPSYTTHAAGPSRSTNPEIDANLSVIEEMSSVVRTSLPETSSVAGTIREATVRSGPRYVYYRLYTKDGAIESNNAIYSNDRSLGRIDAKDVAPPYTVILLKNVLCRKEGFKTSDRSNLYLSVPSYMPMEDGTRLSLTAQSGPGLYEHEPVVLVVDSIDEREAVKPSRGKLRTQTNVRY